MDVVSSPIQYSPYLADSADAYESFSPKVSVVSCFMEYNNQLLILQRPAKKSDQPSTWGIPGGKIEKSDSNEKDALDREIREELSIEIENPRYVGQYYARVPGCPDYILHIYQKVFNTKPDIKLSKEHVASEWVPLNLFKTFPLLKAQAASFDVVYGDQLWQRVKKASDALQLGKREKNLAFSSENRLVITLIGTTGSGKGTQAEFLGKWLGLSSISVGDAFRDEIRGKTRLGQMILDHDAKHKDVFTPDAISLGIVTEKLTDDQFKNGYIFDGFPRSKKQLESLRQVFLRPNDLHISIYMDVPTEKIRERLSSRYICSDCGFQVRAHQKLSREEYCPEEVCSYAPLTKRVEDGDKNLLNKKFEIFEKISKDILPSFRETSGHYDLKLSGDEPVNDVFLSICDIIDKEFNKKFENEQK